MNDRHKDTRKNDFFFPFVVMFRLYDSLDHILLLSSDAQGISKSAFRFVLLMSVLCRCVNAVTPVASMSFCQDVHTANIST